MTDHDPSTAGPAGDGYRARFAGVDWLSDVPLDRFDPAPAAPTAAPAADPIRVVRRAALAPDAPLRTIGRARIRDDGVRFVWGDEASFDLVAGERIDWVPGAGWRGALPVSFYSSVAAITLALRGMLPLHVSSVIAHDRAWLIAGAAGAGKSTLAAELIGAGAALLADDLTVISLDPWPVAHRGRPGIRLHPGNRDAFDQRRPAQPANDKSGKLLAWPIARAADRPWPIGGLILLGGAAPVMLSATASAVAYGSILFRPRIFAGLPGRAMLRAGLLALARAVPVALLPRVEAFDAPARAARLRAAFDTIERLGARAMPGPLPAR